MGFLSGKVSQFFRNTGCDNGYGIFGESASAKSDGWHGDIDEILARFEETGVSQSSCEKAHKTVSYIP